jgi:signal transduction histidine kinase
LAPAFRYSPAIWPLVAVALISALFAAFAWPRRSVAGATPYVIVLAVYAFASLLLALMIAATTLPLKLAFRQGWIICMLVEAWATLALALDYRGKLRTVPTWSRLLIIAPLIIFAGFVITAQRHTYLWTLTWLDGSPRVEGGIVRTLGMAYLYLLAIATLAVLAAAFVRSRGVFRWQAGLLIAGLSLTWLGEGVDALHGDLTPIVDASVIASAMGWLVFYVALFHFRTFDLAPIARDRLVERLVDGVLVLDAQDRVVDLNPAARRMLEPLLSEPIGRRMEETLRSWPELLATLLGPPVAHTTIPRDAAPDVRSYMVSISPLSDPHGQCAGRLVIWHDVTVLRRQQEEVTQQRQALAALDERDRVGKELHDGLGQALGFVSMEAQAARDALNGGKTTLADAYLARIISVAQEAQRDVREFLLGVRAGDALDLGFFEQLEEYLVRYRRQHTIRVELARPPSLTNDMIEPLIQAQLLRIIQESLANTRQHAAATEVRITFTRAEDTLCVAIEDDGQGFDAETLHERQDGHYGLRFMRERAEEVGGTLQIETAPECGVKVSVRVPARHGDQQPMIKPGDEVARSVARSYERGRR